MDRSAPQHPERHANQQDTADSRAVSAEGCQLFKGDQRRQRRDDGEIHHAAGKQQEHQSPAAAHAQSAVLNTHAEGASHPSAPAAH